MILFWLAAAVLAATALAIVVRPLVRGGPSNGAGRDAQNVRIAREQLAELERERDAGRSANGDYEKARGELEESLLGSLEDEPGPSAPGRTVPRPWLLIVAIAVPALSVLLYLQLGNLSAITAGDGAPGRQPAGQPDRTQMTTTRMVELEERLASDPDDVAALRELALIYLSLQRYGDAVRIYTHLNGMDPNDADAMVGLAEALALESGGELSGRPAELIDRALEIRPSHPQGLWLGGMAAEGRGNHLLAMERWTRLLDLVGDNAQVREGIEALIDETRARMGSASGSTGDDAGTASGALASGLSVRVELDPALADRVSPDQTVFVFARAVDGPRMPVAAARLTVAELPADIRLTDAMAMDSGTPLSAFERVLVVARVAIGGRPTASSGDLEGVSGPVPVNSTSAVSVSISRVLE